MPPRTIAPGSPMTVCAWSRTSGPWCSPAASRTVGGSTAHAVPTTASRTTGRGGGEDASGPAQLAAVLGPAEPQQRQARVREQLEHEPGAGEERDCRPERRVQLEQPRGSHRQRRARGGRAGPRASPAGREGAGGRAATSSASPIREHQPHQLERPPDVQDGRQHCRDEERQQRGSEPGLDSASQRVGHDSILRRNPRAATFIPTSVSAAGKAHCAETPARASVRVVSVSAGTVESSARTIQSVLGLELVLGDEAGEQEVVLEAALEARRADHLLGAVQRAVQP